MNNSILYAYEEALKDRQNSLLKQFKKENIIEVVYLMINIVFAIGSVVLIIMHKNKIFLYWIGVFIISIIIWINVFRKINEKRWKKNISEYEEDLDLLREILKTKFNIDEKYKIKQLVHKFNNDIEEYSIIDRNRKEKYTTLFGSYIIPIIAFCAGKLFNELKVEDIMEICFMAIFTIIVVSLLGYAIGVIHTEIIEGNLIERKRNIVKHLQDLLDRDFEITQNDLV